MCIAKFLLIFLLIYLSVLLHANSPGSHLNPQNPEKMYAVWEPLAPDNYTAGVLESECLIKASPEKIRTILLDELDQWEEFMPDTLYSQIISAAKAKRILSENPTSFKKVLELIQDEKLPWQVRVEREGDKTIFYRLTYLDFPWPLGNRWLLTREEDRFNPRQGTFHRRFYKIAGDLVRSEGEWTVKPYNDDPSWTYIRYDLMADGGIHVPHIFYRVGAPKKVKGMFKAIRSRAEGYR
jgi:hypothetical protein